MDSSILALHYFCQLKYKQKHENFSCFLFRKQNAGKESRSVDEISDIHICAVCLENYIDRSPRVLMCQHCFCLQCIKGLVTFSGNIQCPTCRQKTKIPDGGLNNLPVNFMARQMKEHMQKILSKKESICHLCKQMPATKKCQDCTHMLCSSCIDKHDEISAFRGHVIAPVCEKHPEGIVRHICTKCIEEVCSICILNDHREHEAKVKDYNEAVDFLEEQAKKRRQELFTKLETYREAISSAENIITENEVLEGPLLQEREELKKKLKEVEDSLSVIRTQNSEKRRAIDSYLHDISQSERLLQELIQLKWNKESPDLERYRNLKYNNKQKMCSIQ